MTLDTLLPYNDFIQRHIGPTPEQQQQLLVELGYSSMQQFIEAVVPKAILKDDSLELPQALDEAAALAKLRELADQNIVKKSFIGQGYYNTHTPGVILRNIFENPAWYTAYTPYQPEISQGRLEALLNYQTLITDLTGMELANSSLLDEGTAAAEAMTLCRRSSRHKGNVFFVDSNCLPQTIELVNTRAEPLGIEVYVGDPSTELNPDTVFAALLQYPGNSGEISDFSDVVTDLHANKGMVVVAADLLALTLLKPPGEWGADVVIGTSQRFGVPLGFGGPHAGYMATKDKFKRAMPGRLVGMSIDAQGKPALRLALQTREQHIRREKATSNICTAQVLLAVLASMYAVYHGPKGLKRIAERTHALTSMLAKNLIGEGFEILNAYWFDTITVTTNDQTEGIVERVEAAGFNVRHNSDNISVSLDETATPEDVNAIFEAFAPNKELREIASPLNIPEQLQRNSNYLSNPVFNTYHSETDMLRYIRKLSDKDIALDRAMIPLGSCTMKLNATAEMQPVTWEGFSNIHPFAPLNQSIGYRQMIAELEQMLCACTGYDSVSLQPNAGSQGEYAGLLAIQAYHRAQGETERNICLIPSSAHGTNPASAQLAGMKVVVTACDNNGNVDLNDLREKCVTHADNLAAIMITYPSTHGVFETHIQEICATVHDHGGQVYIDGANLNAMVGLCAPGKFGGDVSHLNLHKTFCIPHGGGGPGVGPVAVKAHLAKYLPGHNQFLDLDTNAALDQTVGAVSSAPWGSASILPISWMYITMMGKQGLKQATEVAILNANYVALRLKDHYPVLYTGANGLVAHECILDIRPLEAQTGISGEDIAKRLIDYGFHAPTMSFPVAGTLMIEPTESEPLAELNRFIDAMIAIRDEIHQVARGEISAAESPLQHAPHTAEVLTADDWTRAYPRSVAAYPSDNLRDNKYWPPVGRIDNVYGDRNLVCSCAPIESYMD